MSSEIIISARNLSKTYRIYDHPFDRVRQMLSLGGSKHYREFQALKNVSFEIRKGEAIGIIGRNGSGKSTLLQLLCGIRKPTSGEIKLNGRISALLELGAGFHPEFTGRENVFMQGAIMGLSREDMETRFDDITAFADIGDFINQPIKTYSSGMFVRLAFAVAVAVDPDILVVDEALAVGDALFKSRCYARLQEMKNNGLTLILVSHDQEAISSITSRAILLSQGQVVMIGRPAEVILKYRSQLHEEENRYLQGREKLDQGVISSSASTKPAVCRPTHTRTLSFGDLDAEIISVRILDGNGEETDQILAGDPMIIEIVCHAHIDLTNINIAFRIRNKEGIKITSWGTLNEDIQKLARSEHNNILWDLVISKGSYIRATFHGRCILSPNLYEIQATVTKELDQYYGNQHILHWKDEAAFFTVTPRHRERVFGGICDLGLESRVEIMQETIHENSRAI